MLEKSRASQNSELALVGFYITSTALYVHTIGVSMNSGRCRFCGPVLCYGIVFR